MARTPPRRPSPPLPPDSSPAPTKDRAAQFSPLESDRQSVAMSTVQSPTQRQDLKRVDSLRAPPPVVQQGQPIKDAINSAANDVFEQPSVTDHFGPEFVKQLAQQVTEQVMQNLGAAAATAAPSVSQPQVYYPPPPPPAVSSQDPGSPAASSVNSFAERYTPPTPDRTRDARDLRAYVSDFPEPPLSDVGSSFSRTSRNSISSQHSLRSDDTPKATSRANASDTSRRDSYPSRRTSGPAIANNQEYEQDIQQRERPRRGSKDSESSFDGASRARARPVRVPSDVEETPLERTWQLLFDKGNPTMRLGQFLRGLAMHLIEDYEPKNSIVVTPAKMLQFMNETKLEDEWYPWDMIFGGKMSAPSISKMYQELLCQHHLIQEQHHHPPTVPGLTPWGFDQFMTCVIQAHPESEYERIAKAAMNMPVSNADNKSERFPKELSKRLFPSIPNVQAQQRLYKSVSHERDILSHFRELPPMPPPPPQPASAPPPQSIPERERKPYSKSSTASNAFDDDDLADQPSLPIERERQPYSAREGTGKIYPDESRPPPTAYKSDGAPPPADWARSGRSNPTMPQYNSGRQSDPVNIPPIPPHRMSAGQSDALPQAGSGAYARPVRRSSPPGRGLYGYGESNVNPYQESSRDYLNNSNTNAGWRGAQHSRYDRPNISSQVDDDPRGYPIPGRSASAKNGSEYATLSSNGNPSAQPGSMPVGSYPSRRPPMGPNVNSDRRRSLYNPSINGYGGTDGGTDGYGSFSNSNNGQY